MRFTSFIGMIISFGTIVAGILMLGGSAEQFIDPASILLTVVPTIGAVISTAPFSVLKNVPGHMKALISKEYEPEKYAIQILELAKKARTESLLALEEVQYDDPFMKYGMTMVVDSMDKTYIEESLSGVLSAMELRHNEAITIYEKAASYAPAFGMCATVVGLINMLAGLNFEDSESINKLGGNMSMSLITTLYGSVLANVLFIPIASRLKMQHKKEMFCKELAVAGMLAIMDGANPATLYEMYLRQLPAKSGKKLTEVFGAGGGQ